MLVLGSMPGVRSLAEQRYYAHPRNAMWRILEPWTGATEDYDERCRRLKAQAMALWDVVATCARVGSLDAAIRDAVPNDLAGFAARHAELELVLFNGKKSRDVFDRRTRAGDPRVRMPGAIELRTMPSTSPANTARGKLEAWRRTLAAILDGPRKP